MTGGILELSNLSAQGRGGLRSTQNPTGGAAALAIEEPSAAPPVDFCCVSVDNRPNPDRHRRGVTTAIPEGSRHSGGLAKRELLGLC